MYASDAIARTLELWLVRCTASPAGMCVADRPRPVSLRMRRLRGEARETRRREPSFAIFEKPTKRAYTNALEATKVGCMATVVCD